MAWAYVTGAAQIAGVIAALWGMFSKMRARDDARAATLAEIQTDIRHMLRRLDALEGDIAARRREDEREKRRIGA